MEIRALEFKNNSVLRFNKNPFSSNNKRVVLGGLIGQQTTLLESKPRFNNAREINLFAQARLNNPDHDIATKIRENSKLINKGNHDTIIYAPPNDNQYASPLERDNSFFYNKILPREVVESRNRLRYQSAIKNIKYRPRGLFDAIAGLFGGGGGGNSSSSTPSNELRYNLNLHNENSFKSYIESVNESITKSLITATVSNDTTAQNVLEASFGDISSDQDIVLDFGTINQSIKFVSINKITFDVLNQIGQTHLDNFLQDVTNQISNETNTNFQLAAQNNQSQNILNSTLGTLFNNSRAQPPGSKIGSDINNVNILNQENQNIKKIFSDSLLQTNLATSIQDKILNSVKIQFGSITSKGNMVLKFPNITQTINLMKKVVVEMNLVSKMIASISSSSVYRVSDQITNSAASSASLTSSSNSHDEGISDITDSIGKGVANGITSIGTAGANIANAATSPFNNLINSAMIIGVVVVVSIAAIIIFIIFNSKSKNNEKVNSSSPELAKGSHDKGLGVGGNNSIIHPITELGGEFNNNSAAFSSGLFSDGILNDVNDEFTTDEMLFV